MHLQLAALTLSALLPVLQVRVGRLDGPCDSIEGQTGRLRRELDLRANMEECKVTRNLCIN